MSKFEVICGVEGCCLALDDTRIAGPKPWGGGTVINTWETDKEYKAVNEICYPIDEYHELHGTDCPAWKCSVCGDEFPAESNYCSNCGAWVDKEKLITKADI